MKKLLGMLALFYSIQSFAQSDYALTWNISNLNIESFMAESLFLDLDQGTRFASANGLLTFANGSGSGASGTCFTTNESTAFCNLNVDFISLALTVDLLTLSGTIAAFDQHGIQIDSGTVTLAESL